MLSFGEKTKYWDLIKTDFAFFNSLALKMKDQNPDLVGQMYDYVLATKALLLSNSIKVRQRILSSGNTVLIDKFNNWNAKKELFTKSLSYSSEQLKQENINPESVITIATGGLSNVLMPITKIFDKFDKTLTLNGLHTIAKYALK